MTATTPPPGDTGLDAVVSRRRFLALAGGVAGAAALGASLGPRAWESLFGGASDPAGALGSPGGPRLVLVTLYGGNDGLNTVVPYADPHYAPARGVLALEPSAVLPLADGFGLHPSMPGMKKLWDAKQLGIVHGVGFADPNYSHFESMDIWQSGVPGTPVSTGWIGRWLDLTAASPLNAVGIGPTNTVALTGAKVQGVAVPAGPIVLPGRSDEQLLYEVLARTTRSEALLLAAAARSNTDLITMKRQLGGVLDATSTGNPLHLEAGTAATAESSLAIADGGGGLASPGVLATQLSIVANLILAGSPSEVYSVELGGFDTHAHQEPTQHTLLAELDTALSAFVDALGASPRGRHTVALVYTEFGRRVGGNASGGSDHGWANVAFVAGPSVNGGFYGQPPDLSRLSEGNAAYTTDYRSLYATAFDRVLGVDPSSFLDGSFPTLPFV